MEIRIRGTPEEITAFLQGKNRQVRKMDPAILQEEVQRALRTGEAVQIRGDAIGRRFPKSEWCTE